MSGNALRGEIGFEALGASWVFLLGFNALCALEDEYDAPFIKVLARIMPGVDPDLLADPEALVEAMQNIRMGDVRAFFRAGLSEHHPEVTRETAGAIITELSVPGAMTIIKRSVTASHEAGGSKGTGNPPRRPRRASTD